MDMFGMMNDMIGNMVSSFCLHLFSNFVLVGIIGSVKIPLNGQRNWKSSGFMDI